MTQSSYSKIKLKRNNFYWLVHFISFSLIYSLWWLRLKQRAYNFFREGHPRRSTVTLKPMRLFLSLFRTPLSVSSVNGDRGRISQRLTLFNTDVRTSGHHVTTKFSWLDGFTNFLRHGGSAGAPLLNEVAHVKRTVYYSSQLLHLTEEFQRAVRISTGQTLDSYVVHTVFELFDKDGEIFITVPNTV